MMSCRLPDNSTASIRSFNSFKTGHTYIVDADLKSNSMAERLLCGTRAV
jgi:hypothetical protein